MTESLLTTTCAVLAEKQRKDGQQIQDPAEMARVCEGVTGEDNLFTLFKGLFRGGEGEEAGAEKRALFITNLLAYFYGGGEGTPSSEELGEVL